MAAMDGPALERFLAAARARLNGRHLTGPNARRVVAVALDARAARGTTARQKARAAVIVARGKRVRKRDVALR
jgi:hypothetical protein